MKPSCDAHLGRHQVAAVCFLYLDSCWHFMSHQAVGNTLSKATPLHYHPCKLVVAIDQLKHIGMDLITASLHDRSLGPGFGCSHNLFVKL
jgi:hypothetical protein